MLSRLGDEIRAAREKRSMSLKDLARRAGLAEKMLLDVESGKRIISDEQAGRIMKVLGVRDVATDQEAEVSTVSSPQTIRIPATRTLPPTAPRRDETPVNEAWESALTTILQRVPIYDTAMQELGYRMLALTNGKIEGAPRDRVFYLQAPDNALSGFRMMTGDLLLMLPVKEMPAEGIVLCKMAGQTLLRKAKKLSDGQVQLSVYDRAGGGLLQHTTVPRAQLQPLAIAKRVEFTLG